MVTILLPQTKQSAPLKVARHDSILAERFQNVEIIGWVSCGHPIDILTTRESIQVPSNLIRKNTYALRVLGNSMKDANIIDGDVVIIEQTQQAENGEKVVVQINQREVTLKTLSLDENGVKLVPANSNMQPIILNNADVEILGIVRGVIRDRI